MAIMSPPEDLGKFRFSKLKKNKLSNSNATTTTTATATTATTATTTATATATTTTATDDGINKDIDIDKSNDIDNDIDKDIDIDIDNNITTTATSNDVSLSNHRLLAGDEEQGPRFQQPQPSNHNHNHDHNQRRPLKILYTVTTLSEYDVGDRATTKGHDRLVNLLIPVLKEGVESMLQFGYHVDVVIVAHYKMTRQHLIQEALLPYSSPSPSPSSSSSSSSSSSIVNITIWDEAAPLTYDPGKRDDPKGKLKLNTLALARQHRFVVKDRLMHYDFFCNFEDDMVIKGHHVQNHLEMTQQLFRLREAAPDHIDENDNNQNEFSGPMTKEQLKRVFPGLIRVEALLDESIYGTQSRLDPVPVFSSSKHNDNNNQQQQQQDEDNDNDNDNDNIATIIDPQPCCHLSNFSTSPTRPQSPPSSKIFLWETGIQSLGVRQFPQLPLPLVEGKHKHQHQHQQQKNSNNNNNDNLGWVMMQRGPRSREGEHNVSISDYWSGKDGYFEDAPEKKDRRRPQSGDFSHINNQGGWMATRQQIWEWHTEICPGGFLPPFDSPHYHFDGMDLRNVEYWSGGLNLVTARHACNLQRIVSLDKDRFARHLIYHSSNNKQRQLHGKRSRFVKVNDLYGQLLTVQENAKKRLLLVQEETAW